MPHEGWIPCHKLFPFILIYLSIVVEICFLEGLQLYIVVQLAQISMQEEEAEGEEDIKTTQ